MTRVSYLTFCVHNCLVPCLQSRAAPCSSLIILHDIFDTLESTQLLLANLTRETGHQVLLLNYPGQAFTEITDMTLVTDATIADSLHELLGTLHASGELCIDAEFPCRIVGFGFGGCIAQSYAARHASPALAGLLLVNSFAHVDSQLAAILHSTVNVFSCFPASKPELPITYFSRFLFSDAFVTKVQLCWYLNCLVGHTPCACDVHLQMTKSVAFDMYTACNNPLTLEARVALAKLMLRTSDHRCAPLVS